MKGYTLRGDVKVLSQDFTFKADNVFVFGERKGNNKRIFAIALHGFLSRISGNLSGKIPINVTKLGSEVKYDFDYIETSCGAKTC